MSDKCPYCRNGADEHFSCCRYCNGTTRLVNPPQHPSDKWLWGVTLGLVLIFVLALIFGC